MLASPSALALFLHLQHQLLAGVAYRDRSFFDREDLGTAAALADLLELRLSVGRDEQRHGVAGFDDGPGELNCQRWGLRRFFHDDGERRRIVQRAAKV